MGTVATVKSLQVMGRTFVGDEVDNVLTFQNQTAGAGLIYSVFKEAGSTTAYQVPVAKKLVLYVHTMFTLSGSATSNLVGGLAYGDNSVGDATSTVPTNNVPFFRLNVLTSTGTAGAIYSTESFAAKNWLGYTFKWEVPATKYPHFNVNDGNAHMHLAYGLLKDI